MARWTQSFEGRFWAKVDKSADPEASCWVWTGSRTPKGYGTIYRKGKLLYAHRASWWMHKGPIPEGAQVCHRCDNEPCIRPDHLFLGTPADNTENMVVKERADGASHPGELHPGHKLTWVEVEEIRAAYAAGGVTHQELADQYGLRSKGTIGFITRGEGWTRRTPSPSRKTGTSKTAASLKTSSDT